MKLFICSYDDEKQKGKIVYEEELTEEYRRNLIKLLEKKEDMQITMISEGIQK